MKSARSKMQPFLVDSELLRVSYEISFLSKLEELRHFTFCDGGDGKFSI